MKNKFLKYVLSVCLILACVLTCSACGRTFIKFDSRTNSYLDNYSNLFGDSKEYVYQVVKDWIDDENGENGIPLYEQYKETEPTPSAELARDVKDSFYILALVTNYSFYGDYTDNVVIIDDLRMLLDHFMSLKDDLSILLEDGKNGFETDADILSFYNTAKDLYDGLNTTFDDLLGNTDLYINVYKSARRMLKASLQESDNEQPTRLYDFYTNAIEMVARATSRYDIKYLSRTEQWTNSLNEYLASEEFKTFPTENVLGYVEDDLAGFDSLAESKQKEYVEDSIKVVFKLETFYRFYVLGYNYSNNVSKAFTNNVGPLSYKMLDLFEAIRDEDDANICILATQVEQDINTLYAEVNDEYEKEFPSDMQANIAAQIQAELNPQNNNRWWIAILCVSLFIVVTVVIVYKAKNKAKVEVKE